MAWFSSLPGSIAFLDVETTGLTADDRVVSLGAFWIASGSLCDRKFPTSFVHLIFNPGRKSHPAALNVHGYSDWLLSGQDRFDQYADDVRRFFCEADLIVAHNAEFDVGFVNAELKRAGRRPLDRPNFCTMNACQSRGMRATLASICESIGLTRATKKHGALEDAWLAMMVYLWLHGSPAQRPFSDAGSLLDPFNLRPMPAPESSGLTSDTGRSHAATATEATRIESLVEEVKQLKRDGHLAKAEIVLIAEVERQEAHAMANGGVAPWYYEQLAIVYSKQRRREDEIAILRRYERQPKAPGVKPAILKARLEKLLMRSLAQ